MAQCIHTHTHTQCSGIPWKYDTKLFFQIHTIYNVKKLKEMCVRAWACIWIRWRKDSTFLITTNRVPGCLASYSLYFLPEDDRRFFGIRSICKSITEMQFEENRDFRTMALRTCPVKVSRPRPLQDLGRASAASHNMKLRLAFRLA